MSAITTQSSGNTTQKLTDLVQYLTAWETAARQWNAWIDQEYEGRISTLRQARAKARGSLVNSIAKLQFDRSGRVTRKGLLRFRAERDRVLSGTIYKGLELFAVTGTYGNDGIFRGNTDIKTQAVKQLLKVHMDGAV